MKKINLLTILLILVCTVSAQFKTQSTNSTNLPNLIPGFSQITTINNKVINYLPPTLLPDPTPIDDDTTTEINGAEYYADPLDVNITMGDGNYTATTVGKVWTLKVTVTNTLNVAINFSHFNLTSNAEMYIYNENKTELIGPIKTSHFSQSDSIGVLPISGSSAIIYLVEIGNTETSMQSSIVIGQLVAGFKEINNMFASNVNTVNEDMAMLDNKFIEHGPSLQFTNMMPYDKWTSVDCDPSIQCGDARQLRLARSVALLIVNGKRCTGTLLNNELNNGRPLFLTARHCLDKNKNGVLDNSEISSLTFANFTFQRWANSCNGTSINAGIGFSGATLRAAYSGSDMLLLELRNPPGIADGVNYAGWSRQTYLPDDMASYVIHHPEGNDMRLTKTRKVKNYYLNTDYWKAFYRSGTVAGGSSGSALFNEFDEVIGQLKGGWSGCGIGSSSGDRYGKLNVSWNGEGGANDTRLRNWLSPNQNLTNIQSLDITPLQVQQSGGELSCLTTTNFSVPNLLGCSYFWSVSNNIQIISGQGTSTITVQSISGSSESNGTITVTVSDVKGSTMNTQVVSASRQVKVILPVSGDFSINGTYGNFLQDYNWIFGITKVKLTSTNISNTQWYFWSGDWPTYFQNNANGELEFSIDGDQTVSFVAVSENSCGNNQNNVYTFHRDGIYSYKTAPKIDTLHTLDSKDVDHKFSSAVTKIFPNPAKNLLNIVLSQKNKSTKSLISEVIVYDKIGRAVLNQKLLKQAIEATINVQSLRGDVYFIKIINNNNQSETLKFIKE